MQQQIAHAHDQAVKAALEYLEKNAFSSRDRSGDSPLQGIIAATFQHSTSRELDPQLHTHCAIANIGLRQDGSVCALDLDSRFKIGSGSIYRCELANSLQALGLEVERDGKSFKLSAVPDDLCKQFSKRRQQIESYLDEHGFHDSAKAANVAALATRKAKESPNRGILQQQWQREAAEAGYSQETIKQMLTPGQPIKRDHPKLDIPGIISGLTQNESFFTRQQLEAAIAIECQGVCGAGEIPIIIERAIRDGLSNLEQDGLVKLDGPADNQKSRRKIDIYTTREMLQLEREALYFAVSGKDDRRHVVPVDPKLLVGLSDEQANAVLHITQSSRVTCVRGLAGTGKSYAMKIAKIAWQGEGLDVVGAALAGKAADGLEQSSGIKSQTLHSLLAELDSGSRVLSEKSVVVLDECGMLGTKMLHRVMQHIEQSNSRLVLCGDPQQLQSINAGGLFKGISDRIGYAELTDIRRQKNLEDRETIKKLIAGDAEEVIERLHEAGQLRIERDDQVAERMVDDWLETRDPGKPGEALMLAGTRAEVRTLNMIARAKLVATGQLHSEVTIPTEHGERSFFVGERICLGRNNRSLNVKNGQLGTLESWSLHPRTGAIELSVCMDGGDVLAFDPAQYGHIDSGFAMSVHRSQGVTADKVSVLMNEQISDLQWSGVAISRHRERLRVFVPQSMEDGLSRGIGRSRQKVLATDQLKKQKEQSLEQ
jgi:Ti-type conjugative transfer relaxase TraA